MNFEFLKDLHGFQHVYENCSNAEKLAMTMPEQSMFTSRKSAELLAKFLFLVAHKQEEEELSFVEVLSDPAFKRYVNNRNVIDAFHYIRKTGNRAVHSDEKESPETAIRVLEDLHYVAGEAARLLGLIKDYPAFIDDIEAYPNAQFVDETEVEKKAQEMFMAFMNKMEENMYIGQDEYDWTRYSIEGNVEMHEYLEFNHKPKSIELIEFLQEYLHTLFRLSIERAPEKADELELAYPVTLDARILIDERVYSSKERESFLQAIDEMLSKADHFIIDCTCSGVLREYYNDDLEKSDYRLNMIRRDAAWTGAGMLDRLEAYKRREPFTYHMLSFLPDSGSLIAASIEKGRSRRPEQMFDSNINLYPDLVVECGGLGIFCESDKNIREYPELFEAIKQLVRENVYEPQLHFCESAWNPNDDNYVEDCILSYVQINAGTIGEYGAFLDRLNHIVAPWRDHVKLYADEIDLEASQNGTDNNVLYNIQEFVLAQVVSIDGELKIVGTVLNHRCI